MEEIILTPIGTIFTPFTENKGTPIQPGFAGEVKGHIKLKKEYIEGLKDLDGFSHIILLYYFNRSGDYKLQVKPFLDNEYHGVFATRAPSRPNSIGLSVVKLEKIENDTLYLSGVDILNNTPLLDIKPFIPHFDCPENVELGWIKKNVQSGNNVRDDGRFL